MHKHAETFHNKKGYKLTNTLFLYQFHRFQNGNFWYVFQTLFAQKRGLAHSYLLYKNESPQHCFSYDLRKMEKCLILKAIFQWVLFLVGPFFLRYRVWVRACFERMQLAGKAQEKTITFTKLVQLSLFLQLDHISLLLQIQSTPAENASFTSSFAI